MEDQAAKNPALWNALYGISKNPFLARDRQYIALSQREEALAALKHLALFSEKLLLMTGPPGSGKSELLREFMRRQDGSMILVVLRATAQGDFPGLLEGLLAELGLPQRDEPQAEKLARIEQSCRKRSESGLKTVVTIDNADLLGIELLSAMVNSLKVEGDSLSLVLVGSDELPQRVRSALPEWVEEGRVGRVALKPLSLSEAREYIQHTLRGAGWTGSPPLDEALVTGLRDQGRGQIGTMNRLAERVLLTPRRRLLPALNLKPENLRTLGVVGASLLLALALVSWLYQASDEPETLDLPPLAEETHDKRVTVGLKLPVPPVAEPRSEDLALQWEPIDIPGSDEETREVDALLAEGDRGLELGQPDPARAEEMAETELEPEPVPEPEPEPEPKLSTGAPVESAPTASAEEEGPSRSQAWMNRQDVRGWTVQLLGSQNRSAASAYVRSWNVSTHKPFWFESTYQGKQWYIVLLGVFPNKADARSAMEALPATVRRQGPWLRSIKGLQSDL